ncbi:uncharacterized protein LOC120491211 [Pimephales promelas]|uniref:uncharacterized protein LOC120491211 n=1 Tax=Pimephales promelas TaxID=90988 RepID=UPI001955512C|nr:uncharacterized protein LOC120491211 [Pimephales promelas]XP_039544832.1 uncharacterized protein LOC120491211 [Pimephales promelas]
MSRKVEVIINTGAQQDQSACPVYITESKPGDAPGVTGFLKINPAVLGWLEILTGGVAFGLVFWNYERWFLIPTCYLILNGVVTAIAACTRNPCLVVTAQVLNLFNIFSSLTVFIIFFLLFYVTSSVRVFLAPSLGPTEVAFMACNAVALLLSVIIFATLCCWCKSRKRLMVIHMSSASPDVVSDVMDRRPASSPPSYYSPVPPSDPPAYEDERRSTLSRASAARWDKRRWIDELHRSRKSIQV